MALVLLLVHPDEAIEQIVWEDPLLRDITGVVPEEEQFERLRSWVVERLSDRQLAILEPHLALLNEGILAHLHRLGGGSPTRLHVGPVPHGPHEERPTKLDTHALDEGLHGRNPLWGVYDHPNAAIDLICSRAEAQGLQVHTWRMAGGFAPPLNGAITLAGGDGAAFEAGLQAALEFQPTERTLLLFVDLPILEPILEMAPAAARLTQLVRRVEQDHRLRLMVLRPEEQIPPRWRGMFRLIRVRTAHSSTPILDALAEDFTALARTGRLNPVVGREAEIERIWDILGHVSGLPNSPLLVGPAGVGKTAVVELLAQRIVDGAAPERFLRRRVMSLNVTALGAQAERIGGLESQLRALQEELREHSQEIIVFVDEIHTLMDVGGPEAPAAQALKTALGRGEFALIGATTDREVVKIEQDEAFNRRFSRVVVAEPDIEATTEIALQWRERLEQYHGISIPRTIIETAVIEADWHLRDQHRPYTAISILGDAAARAQRIRGTTTVDDDDIREALRLAVGVDVRPPGSEELARLHQIEGELLEAIVGQEQAIRRLMRQVYGRRFRRDRIVRPFSVLLGGPTGVGKTESAIMLGRRVFPGTEPVIYHMESYTQGHQMMTLIGAPSSYVGYERGSLLVNDIRRNPRVALIFDEIEKANQEVAQVLMGILDRGEYIDPRGARGDFRHAFFIFTSNVFPDAHFSPLPRDVFEQEIRQRFAVLGFPPEQVGRFGEPIQFLGLDQQARTTITARALDEFAREEHEAYGVELRWDDDLPEGLAQLATAELGVRSILSRIQDLRGAVADVIFDGAYPPRTLRIWLDDGELHVEVMD